MIRHKSPQSGFTLVEAALVVVIGGTLLSAAASMLNAYLQELKIQTTQNRMQDIDNALVGYLNINGVLPCVASMTGPNAIQDSPLFGVEGTDPPTLAPGGGGPGTDCKSFATGAAVGAWTVTTGVTAPPLAPLAPGLAAAGTIVMGAVPVRTLNLPDQDIADAWGNLFTYAVTDNLTISTPANGYDQTQGAIAVIGGTVNYIAPTGGGLPAITYPGPPHPTDTNPAAQYVIVSYGVDGAGAYTLGGANPVPCPAAPALGNTNCALSTTNTFRSAPLNSDKTGAGYFDNYVIFHSLIAPPGTIPYGMIMPFALSGGCPPGWSDYVQPLQSPAAVPVSCLACTPTSIPPSPTCPAPGPYIFCCQKQ